MFAEPLQAAMLVERARHEIDADWVKGIRKGWKQAVAKARAYPGRYEKAGAIDFDKLRASADGAEGSLNELLQYTRALRADLLVNKGFWTTSTRTRKERGKGFTVDFDALKAKVVAGLDKAENAVRETMGKVRFWRDVLTPGTGEHRLDGGRRFADAGDDVGQFQRYVNSVYLSVEEGADVAERAINVMLDWLRDAMGKLPNAFAAIGQRGAGEPAVVHLGKVTLFFADSPEATAKPTGLMGGSGKAWLPAGPTSRGHEFVLAKPRSPQYRKDYIDQLKKTEALLRQRGLSFLWYGKFSVHCKECGGENPAGPEWTVGAMYYRQGDYIAIHSDAHAHLYRLIAHELGHRYYYKFMSAQDRANFDRFFGQVKVTSPYGGVNSAEDFAEVFNAYVDGRDLDRDQIDRIKQFIKGNRKLESAPSESSMIHEQLSSALAERKAKTSKGERRYTVGGKKGVWRTSDAGHKLFIPDDGSSPLMNPHVRQGKGKVGTPSADTDDDSDKGGAKGDVGGVTASNWKDKLKALAVKAGHKLIHPFVAMKDLATKPEARAELKAHIKKSIKKEVAETKRMVGTIGRALKGESVSAEDRNHAIHQAADLVKTAMMAMAVTHIFAGGAVKALATLASPADEVVGMAIDAPIRAATKRVFGQAHGLLPSAFYEGVESPDALMDKIVDAILDELGKGHGVSEQLAAAM